MRAIFYKFSANLFLLLGLSLVSSLSFAQPYPVSSSVQITSANIPYLDNLVRENPSSILHTLILTDLTQSSYDVVLQLDISGMGISIRTKEEFIARPITLFPNVPVVLTGFELAELFNPDNLNFQGLSREQFLQNPRLPEGQYSICITAFDANRMDRLSVSNNGCALGLMEEHDPPILINPIGLQNPIEPQFLQFNWHPMHRTGFETEYEVSIYPVIDDLQDNQIFDYTSPIARFSSTTPFYLYTLADPHLERGQEYLWRVRARDVSSINRFKNGGFSEPVRFVYGEQCPLPEGLLGMSLGPSSHFITWNVDGNFLDRDIQIRYRPFDSIVPNTDWQMVNASSTTSHTLESLSAAKYEVQIMRDCSFGYTSEWTSSLIIEPGNIVDPEQLLPPNATEGTEITSNAFRANWIVVDNATAYLLDVSSDPNFNTILPNYNQKEVTGTSHFIEGLVENEVYYYRLRSKKNAEVSGFSNVISIQFADQIEAPLALEAEGIEVNRFIAMWQPVDGVNTYQLEVAEDENFQNILPGYDNVLVNGSSLEILEVEPQNQNYFYRLKTVDEGLFSPYSNTVGVSTGAGCVFAPPEDIDYACGLPTAENPFGDFPLVADLAKGDSIMAGDFKIILTKLSGSGPYYGEGYTLIPFLEQSRVNVKLKNVQVNSQCRMVDGLMQVTGVGADLFPDEWDEALDNVLDVLSSIDSVLATAETILSPINDVLNSSDSLDGYFTKGWNVLQGVGPIQAEYPWLSDPVINQLEESLNCFGGNPPSECTEGFKTAIAAVVNELDELYAASFRFEFEKDPNDLYGFDAKEYEALKDEYNTIDIAGSSYNVAWKSVPSGDSSTVIAKFKGSGAFPDNVIFQDNSENTIRSVRSDSGSSYTLTVGGLTNDEIYQIYAIEQLSNDSIHLAGKLNVVTYDPIELNAVIIPVNAVALPFQNFDNLSNKIDTIFKQAIVNTTISPSPGSPLEVNGFNGIMSDLSSGILANYSSEMQDIINAYQSSNPIDNDTYYLFVVQGSNRGDLRGFMPQGKNFGFLFKDAIEGSAGGETASAAQKEAAYVHTVAHELGHGPYILEHTWKNHPALEEGSSNNLMDYSDGERLVRYQWHQVHHPGVHWALFDGDEEGRYVTIGNIQEVFEPYKVGNHITFVSNYGEPVILEFEKVSNLVFATGGEEYVHTGGSQLPVGTLSFFTLDIGQNQSKQYANFGNGKYAEYNGTGSVFNEANKYVEPLVEVVQPYACRITAVTDKIYIHIVPHLIQSGATASLLGYDQLIESFFNLSNGEVKHPNNIVEVNGLNTYLDEILSSHRISSFTSDFGDHFQINQIEGFYLPGIIQAISKIESYSNICNNEAVRLESFIYRALEAFRLTSILADGTNITGVSYGEGDPSLLENSLNKIYQNGFFNTSGLSQREVAKYILGDIDRNALFQEYQNRINNLNNDLDAAKSIVDDLYSFDKFLLPCQVDLLTLPDLETWELMIDALLSKFINPEPYFQQSISSLYDQWVMDNEEAMTLKFLRKTSPQEYIETLNILSQKEPTFQKYRLDLLVTGIENGLMFDDNGKTFLTWLKGIYSSVVLQNEDSNYKSNYENLISKIDIVENGSEETIASGIENLPIIPYDYTAFLGRIEYLSGLCYNIIVPAFTLNEWFCNDETPPFIPPTSITNIEYTSEGKLRIIQRNKYLFLPLGDPTALEEEFDPFAPIIIDKNSTFGYADALTSEEEYVIVPAILLYLLEEEGWNTTTRDLIFTALDVATLPVPISKISTISRVVSYLDKVGSVTGIISQWAAGTNAEISPESVVVINVVSAICGLAGIHHSPSSWSNGIDINKLAKNPDIDLRIEGIESGLDVIDEAYANGKLADPNLYPLAIKEGLGKAIKIHGKDHFNGSTITETRIANAIEKLRSTTRSIPQFPLVNRNLNLLESSLSKFENTNANGILDIVAHSENSIHYFDGNPVSTNLLADMIRNELPNGGTVRLLSCATLSEARKLIDELGDGFELHATEGMVRIFNDGGVKVVERTSNGNTDWYKLNKGSPDEILPAVNRPPPPDETVAEFNPLGFIELGSRIQIDNLIGELRKLHPNLVGIDRLESGGVRDALERLSEVEVKAFFEDVHRSAGIVGKLGGELGELNGGWVEAWDKIRKAISNTGGTTDFAIDVPTLQKVKDIMATNSTFRQNVGNDWSIVLNDLLYAAKNSPCDACPDASGLTLAFPSLEKHLENVEYFVENFQANGKADKFFYWMRGKKKDGSLLGDNSTVKSEMAQTLYELKRRGLTEADINQFGAKYTTNPASGTSSRESDILLTDGTHIELKNKPYTANTIPTDQEIDQVLGQNGAFGNIFSLNEFEWIAFANRGNDATNLKTMWKNVFVNKADDMFKSVEDGGLGINKIKQLFGNDVDDVSDFLDVIEDVNDNPIYDFIKTK